MADIVINISGQATSASNAVDQLISKLEQLSTALDGVGRRVKTAFGGFENIGNSLTGFQHQLDGIQQQMDGITEASRGMSIEMRQTTTSITSAGQAASKSAGFFETFGKSIGRIAFYRLLRTAIKEVGKAFKEGLTNAIAFSRGSKSEFAKLADAVDSISKSAGTMKNQLGAALGGLITAIAPAINAVINLITRLATAITQLFALLGGSGVYKKATAGFESVKKSAGGAGGAVKGLLAAWDELKVIGQESGGGGGGGTQDVSDAFEYEKLPQWMVDIYEQSGFGKALEKFETAWNNFKESKIVQWIKELALETLLDALTGIVNVSADVIDFFTKLDEFLDDPNFDNLKDLGESLKTLVTDCFKPLIDLNFDLILIPLGKLVDDIAALVGFKTGVEEFFQSLKKGLDTGEPDTSNPTIAYFVDNANEYNKIKKEQLGKQNEGKPTSDIWETIKEAFGINRTSGVAFDTDHIEIVKKWKTACEDMKKYWQDVWDESVREFEEFKEKVSNVLNAVKDYFIGVWEETKAESLQFAYNLLMNVIKPIAVGFATFIDVTTNLFANMWSGFLEVARLGANGLISIINGAISGLNWAGQKVAAALGKTWEDIEPIPLLAEDAFDSMEIKASNCAEYVEGVFDGIGDRLTKEMSANPVITYHYRTVGNAVGNGISGAIGAVNANFAQFASGGFPSQGQLFIANEQGAEYVGSIGNRTAVANSDQIVEGIKTGVADANATQNELLRQQNSLLTKLLEKDLSIRPSAALGQVIAKSNALYGRT